MVRGDDHEPRSRRGQCQPHRPALESLVKLIGPIFGWMLKLFPGLRAEFAGFPDLIAALEQQDRSA
jgi:hypothetical protein